MEHFPFLVRCYIILAATLCQRGYSSKTGDDTSHDSQKGSAFAHMLLPEESKSDLVRPLAPSPLSVVFSVLQTHLSREVSDWGWSLCFDVAFPIRHASCQTGICSANLTFTTGLGGVWNKDQSSSVTGISSGMFKSVTRWFTVLWRSLKAGRHLVWEVKNPGSPAHKWSCTAALVQQDHQQCNRQQ